MSQNTQRANVDVGVVGTGHVTSFHHLPILSHTETATVKYLADINWESARKLSKNYDAQPIDISAEGADLPDCDVAFLAVPVGVREPYIEAFGDQDIPIFTEKPFAPDVETHRRFLDVSVPIACNYQRWNYSTTRTGKTLVESGVFGRLERMSVSRDMTGSTGVSQSNHRLDSELSGGGVLMDIGCHMLSQITHVLSGYRLSVAESTVHWVDDLDVGVHAVFDASSPENSLSVELNLSMIDQVGTGTKLNFEKAVVTFDQSDPEGRITVSPKRGGSSFRISSGPEWATTEKQAIYLRWEQFLRRVTEQKGGDASRETGFEITGLIDGIYGASDD